MKVDRVPKYLIVAKPSRRVSIIRQPEPNFGPVLPNTTLARQNRGRQARRFCRNPLSDRAKNRLNPPKPA